MRRSSEGESDRDTMQRADLSTLITSGIPKQLRSYQRKHSKPSRSGASKSGDWPCHEASPPVRQKQTLFQKKITKGRGQEEPDRLTSLLSQPTISPKETCKTIRRRFNNLHTLSSYRSRVDVVQRSERKTMHAPTEERVGPFRG